MTTPDALARVATKMVSCCAMFSGCAGLSGWCLDRSRIEWNLRRLWPILCEGQDRLRNTTLTSVPAPSRGATALASGLAVLLSAPAAGAEEALPKFEQPRDEGAEAVEADTPPGSTGSSGSPAILWYRSTEGCPDGPTFLEAIGERASLVRLAEAGDRVDFVVTLSRTEDGAQGRLERETGRGTVAIREVRDPSCERVAEVVALNLSLALEPDRSGAVPEPVSETDEPGEPARETADGDEETTTPTSDEPSVTERSEPGPAPRATDAHEGRAEAETPRFRVGLQGGVTSGITTGLLGQGTLFLEVSGLVSAWPQLTFRVAGLGGGGHSGSTLGPIEQTLWAGRLELCPARWGRGALSLSPCVAAELGVLQAAGPLSDSAPWWAVSARARGVWEIGGPVALEADLGANIPLSQYEIRAGATLLYQSAPAGISAALGASVAF